MYSTEFLHFIIEHYNRCRKLFKYYPFHFHTKLNRFVHVTSRRGEKMLKLLNLIMLSYTIRLMPPIFRFDTTS